MWLLDQREPALGESLMLDFSDSPSAEDESSCSLSEVLITGAAPPRYFLSARACAGLLRRAERRGKTLPPMLRQALRAVAEASGDPEKAGGKIL